MRTLPVKEIVKKLNQILVGYYHYYGITDNSKAIASFKYRVTKSLFYWLNSVRGTLSNGCIYSTIKFFLLNGNCSVVVRSSGTEPKLKVYISVSVASKEDAEVVEVKISECIKKIF